MNIGFDIANVLLDWVDVRDDVECEDCWRLGARKPLPFWKLGHTPGDGRTECKKRCRCVLVPHYIFAANPSIDGLTAIKINKNDVYVTEKIGAALWNKIDLLVSEYESITLLKYEWEGGFNLPAAYYDKYSKVRDRIDYLARLNRRIETNSLTEIDKIEIIKRNPGVTL